MALSPETILPDIGRGFASARARIGALVVAIALTLLGIAMLEFDGVQLPHAKTVVAISATIWIAAGALTALLLFGQFAITGAVGFLAFACAYEFAALLTIPYLVNWLDVVPHASIGEHQITGSLWAIWHLVFPTLVIIGFAFDPLLERRLARTRLFGRSLGTVAASATFAFALLVTAFVLRGHDALPITIVNGHSTPLYRYWIAPLVGLANLLACMFALTRGRRATSLGVWIAFAAFAAMLDAIVNDLSRSTYSPAWYYGKFQASLAATVVLAMLLVEIAGLYRRLSDLATRDALTGLRNRRGIDEYMRWTFQYASRRELGIALLMIDIDHFKRYNDLYGHALGDAALCRVASVIRDSEIREYDLVARYGGEEFVMILLDASDQRAIEVAEKVRGCIEREAIPHAAVELGRLSISIGIARSRTVTTDSLADLFKAADRCLYEAKQQGRDRYVYAP